MARDIREAILRSRDHLLGDALGVVALVLLLVGGLHLPGLV